MSQCVVPTENSEDNITHEVNNSHVREEGANEAVDWWENCWKDAEKIKDALVDMSDNWSNGLMNPDDITIVVIKKAI